MCATLPWLMFKIALFQITSTTNKIKLQHCITKFLYFIQKEIQLYSICNIIVTHVKDFHNCHTSKQPLAIMFTSEPENKFHNCHTSKHPLAINVHIRIRKQVSYKPQLLPKQNSLPMRLFWHFKMTRSRNNIMKYFSLLYNL